MPNPRTPSTGGPPVPEMEAPPTPKEIEKRMAEAEKLEEVGRLLESSPTQQLAQMAVKAGPSSLGGKELAQSKLRLTIGGKAPWKEFQKVSMVKKP